KHPVSQISLGSTNHACGPVRLVGSVNIVHPIAGLPPAVPAIHHHPRSATLKPRRPIAPHAVEEGLSQKVRAQRLWRTVYTYIGQTRQLFSHPVSYQVYLVPPTGQVPRERKVGHVHTAGSDEVSTHQKIGPHAEPAARREFSATPNNPPLNNQYCRPCCVVNGVKPKVSA